MSPTLRFIFFLLFFNNLQAQEYTIQWAQSLGGSSIEIPYEITTDSDNNVYLGGIFSENYDFDPSPTDTHYISGNSKYDGFLAKYNKDGEFLWAQQLGGPSSYDAVAAIACDSKDNIWAIGTFSDSLIFDNAADSFNLYTGVESQIFIVKFNKEGQLLFSGQIGSWTYENYTRLTIDKFDNVWIGGSFQYNINLNPAVIPTVYLSSYGLNDCYFLKLNNEGEHLLSGRIGHIENDYIHAITSDTFGNIFLAGRFGGTVDFDPSTSGYFGMTDVGMEDGFVAKLDNNGNFIWAGAISGPSSQDCLSIDCDADGNVWVGGKFWEQTDFDFSNGTDYRTPWNRPNIQSDIFVAKYSSDGDLLHATTFGTNGLGHEVIKEVVVDNKGNAWLMGQQSYDLFFDGQAAVENLKKEDGNTFLIGINSSGYLFHPIQYGKDINASMEAMTIDKDNKILLSGTFQGTCDANPSEHTALLDSVDGSDIFFLKMSMHTSPFCTATNAIHIDLFPNPSVDYITLDFDIPTFEINTNLTIVNQAGKVCARHVLQNHLTHIDVSDFAAGVYYFQLTSSTGKKICTPKVVKYNAKK